MTQQLQEALSRIAVLDQIGAAVQTQGSQPVFFFDGEFRTRQQLEQRAQLNRAIAAHIFRGLPQTLPPNREVAG